MTHKDLLKDDSSGPISVAFTITSKCNYKCRHCYNNSGDDIYKDMSDEELLDVTEQICELRPLSVCLCGGEPLIRGEIVYKIAKKLSDNCGIVNLVTNGSTINEKVLDKLKAAGINTIQISLDGSTPFMHNNIRLNKDAFDMAVNAIRLSKEKGFRVAVSCCPNKLNRYSTRDIAKLVYELGADELRFMPLILMGRGADMQNLELSSDEYLLLQQEIENLKNIYRNKELNISWGDPIDHLYRMPVNAQNDISTYSLEIRFDGKLTISTYLPIVVGDVKKHKLREYWYFGYNKIWKDERILKYVSDFFSTSQFNNFKPKPYSGKDINLDLL